MKIKIVCFNKISKEFKDAYNMYLEKLSKHSKIDVIQIQEVDFGDIKSNRVRNEQNILEKLNILNGFEIFLLDINARQYSSEDIVSILKRNQNYNSAKLCFIIGPSDGFSSEFRIKWQNKLSFGPLTLPYNLVRIILLEQLYRGFKISKNQKYHK
ncbi:23S rRNA (pseudouridine(1915)-N(3))-methyltransferase RlmH [Spiroplasma taiwanense]|uniref:Ribosomal RNA large subunit methyltransferase H n=1 Tax=Spiroplasma taiwanense CT-1 TaxID=1276220 RepID=S5LTD7_9MOLU|nr:23S rRNA (pseudouridine(1915)-N(3))-methyltransferase RlmH [Spiroplasma taiwanense]AGR40969.1 rRNA large subunit methyltransferase [Spiroplasma taiwanense CT-1]